MTTTIGIVGRRAVGKTTLRSLVEQGDTLIDVDVDEAQIPKLLPKKQYDTIYFFREDSPLYRRHISRMCDWGIDLVNDEMQKLKRYEFLMYIPGKQPVKQRISGNVNANATPNLDVDKVIYDAEQILQVIHPSKL